MSGFAFEIEKLLLKNAKIVILKINLAVIIKMEKLLPKNEKVVEK